MELQKIQIKLFQLGWKKIPDAFDSTHYYIQASLVAQMKKESACNAGDLGSIPGFSISLQEGMATHSRIFHGRIPMDRVSGRLQAMISQRVGHD